MMKTISPALDLIPEDLLSELKTARPALLTNAAARSLDGIPSDMYLSRRLDVRLACIFAPEHGFSGKLAAGKTFASGVHPALGIPIHSLYGNTKRPDDSMLDGIDTVIIDMQILAARPYTYCSTAAMMIEECAARGIRVIVLDRPVPVPSTVDGPSLDERFTSFVSYVPCPMAFGMTLGEMSNYLVSRSDRKPDLRVIKASGFSRKDPLEKCFTKKWIPPSPAITTYEAAATYLATVFAESFPSMFETRKSGMPFRCFGAEWMDAGYIADFLNSEGAEGAMFKAFKFPGTSRMNCIQIKVRDYDSFMPAQTSARIISAILQKHGSEKLWNSREFKQDHFDRLWGTEMVRKELSSGATPAAIIKKMQKSSIQFRRERKKYLLY